MNTHRFALKKISARATHLSNECLVGIDTLAKWLGIPKRTIYKWSSESSTNSFPVVKCGRHLRFSMTAVSSWLLRYHGSEGAREFLHE